MKKEKTFHEKKRDRMKKHFYKWHIIFIALILISASCNKTKEFDSEIEGIHYINNTPIRIGIKDGKIADIHILKKLTSKDDTIFIAPGLIDNQVNGYKGYSFVDIGQELTLEGIKEITSGFWEVGITTYIPTLVTSEHNIHLKNLKLLATAKKDIETRGSIAGFHLEGPYVSPENGYRGAHLLMHVRKPNWDEFKELYDASEENILQTTLAPEIDGAFDFISKCKEKGVVVALGHHNASSVQINEAIDRGAVIATHLGNAIPNYIHRWNNTLWPQLAEERLNIGMICDGFHLTPEQIKVFYKTKGSDKIIMTSDMSPYGGLTPGFYFNAIGDTLELKAEGVVMYPANESLSGSASPLSKMVGYVMKVTGCNLADAIKMASTNAAQIYGLDDRGELKQGMRADLILFSLDDFTMNIKKTIVEGDVVFDSSIQK